VHVTELSVGVVPTTLVVVIFRNVSTAVVLAFNVIVY